MMAMTAVERGGRARARKGKTHSERTIVRTVYDWADRDGILVTDELPAYRWIGRKFRAHLPVTDSAGEWTRLDPHGRGMTPRGVHCVHVHTCPKGARQHANTVESFNATICTRWTPRGVKRAIIGVWDSFSIKHGDRFLNELAARWNWRGMDNMDRFDIALDASRRPLRARGLFEPALPWKALTA